MMKDKNEKIIVQIERKVATLTLNNGDLNIFNPEFIYIFRDVLKSIKENKKVNVIIIQSASDRAFSAGFDLKSLNTLDGDIIDIFIKDGYEIVELLYKTPKPIISLINKHALGVGFLFPLACDFRYCTNDAQFQLPEINFGELLFPSHGGCTTLLKVVNTVCDAKYILMTGNKIDAKTALKMGIISKVFDTKAEMLKEGKKFARLLASKPRFTMQLIKAAVNKNLNDSFDNGIARGQEAGEILRIFDEKREERKDNFVKKYMNG